MARHLLLVVFVAAVVLPFSLRAEEGKPASEPDPAPKTPEAELEDVVVTATRSRVKLGELPFRVSLYDREELEDRKLFRTTPEILSEDPAVLVQKTSYGMGSPYLRGFTGFRTLFLIDGIRLNNAIFREGPNQYWNTVDPFLMERFEVVKGMASVLYGSDAVGGTVQAVSKSVRKYAEGFHLSGRAQYRLSLPDLSSTGRVDLDAHFDRIVSLHVGLTGKTFGNLVTGPQVGEVPRSGYDEVDADLKAEVLLDRWVRLVFAFQHTDQRDVWRTHKTVFGVSWHGTSPGKELRRSFDHLRDLGYVQFHAEKLEGLLEEVHLNLSVHRQFEERKRVKSSGSGDIQCVETTTPGLWGNVKLDTPVGMVTLGCELYQDRVGSSNDKYNADGSYTLSALQGPVGDHAWYDVFGAFLQDELAPIDGWKVIAGLRYTWVRAVADRVSDPDSGDRIRVSDIYDNLSVGLRTSVDFLEYASAFAGVSSAFRAPNLSDLTRLDTARSNEIETPSPGLDPELFWTVEVGCKAEQKDVFRFSAVYFYTVIIDGIVRYPTGVLVDGDNEVRKANVGDGWVHGFEVSGSWSPVKGLTLAGAFSISEGKQDTYATVGSLEETREWMSRVPPPAGTLSARYELPDKKAWAEVVWQGAGPAEKLSPRDETDTQRIPPGGTPGWGVVHLRGGVQVAENVNLNLAVRNLLNKDYRVHGSGQNEPGLGVTMALDVKW